MHTENLGEKTYLMAIDPDQIERNEAGNGTLTFMSGSTETRLNIKGAVVATMPTNAFMAVVTGDAKLHITINDDCTISGFEEMDVESVTLSEVAMRETPFVEHIPF